MHCLEVIAKRNNLAVIREWEEAMKYDNFILAAFIEDANHDLFRLDGEDVVPR